MVDDILELSAQSGSLKNKIGSYDEKRKKSTEKLLKQVVDGKRANWKIFRIENKIKKQ